MQLANHERDINDLEHKLEKVWSFPPVYDLPFSSTFCVLCDNVQGGTKLMNFVMLVSCIVSVQCILPTWLATSENNAFVLITTLVAFSNVVLEKNCTTGRFFELI